MPDNTKSPYLEERSFAPTTITLHFYRPSQRIPLWIRLLWRPVFAHVVVQWDGAVQSMPYNGTCEWHDAKDYLANSRPDVSMPLPVSLNIDDQATASTWITHMYEDRTTDKWGCVKWYLKRRRYKPLSCATLASSWVNLFTKYTASAVTPDELFSELLLHSVRE